MTAAMAGFAFNDLLIKGIGNSLSIGQIVLFRGIIATSLVLYLCVQTRQLGKVRRLSPLILVRAMAEAVATYCFLQALFAIPITELSAVMQALPLAVTVGAAIFLGERFGWRRLIAIGIGFIGVFLIIRPGFSGFSVYSVYALAAVAACTVRDLVTRRLAGDVPSLVVTLATTVLVTILGGALALGQPWHPVAMEFIGVLALASVFIIVGYHFAVAAMRVGEIGFVSPFRYSILLFSAAGGALFYGEIPDFLTIVGACIIILTGIYTIFRERKAHRQAITLSPTRQ
jgi:drug/metabolite transporter (DMT)-like permease